MAKDEFLSELRRCLYRRPFEPFVIEMKHDLSITVDNPEGMAIGGGAASYFGSDELYLIDCEQVRAILPSTRTVAP